LRQADQPVLEEGVTTCCYANSEKTWIKDPQGLSWETFLTLGESAVYGHDVDLDPLQKKPGACCAPEAIAAPAAACCSPKHETAA
jgi:hypothetical protein